jgi:hypothetical protein
VLAGVTFGAFAGCVSLPVSLNFGVGPLTWNVQPLGGGLASQVNSALQAVKNASSTTRQVDKTRDLVPLLRRPSLTVRYRRVDVRRADQAPRGLPVVVEGVGRRVVGAVPGT